MDTIEKVLKWLAFIVASIYVLDLSLAMISAASNFQVLLGVLMLGAIVTGWILIVKKDLL